MGAANYEERMQQRLEDMPAGEVWEVSQAAETAALAAGAVAEMKLGRHASYEYRFMRERLVTALLRIEALIGDIGDDK